MTTAPTEAVRAEEEEEAEVDEAGVDDENDNTLLVLDLLHEMAFKARLLEEDIETERGAVLSELKDRDSISQRIAMEYYRFHHADTMLPTRFPIGLEKLVRNFKAADFRAFYHRHYYPANMCLYITGDIDAADMAAKIAQVFAEQPSGPRDGAPMNSPTNSPDPAEGDLPVIQWPRRGKLIEHGAFLTGSARSEHLHKLKAAADAEGGDDGTAGAVALRAQASKSVGADNDASYHAVSHQLLTEFSVSLCTKREESQAKCVGDLRQSLVDSLIGTYRVSRVACRVSLAGRWSLVAYRLLLITWLVDSLIGACS